MKHKTFFFTVLFAFSIIALSTSAYADTTRGKNYLDIYNNQTRTGVWTSQPEWLLETNGIYIPYKIDDQAGYTTIMTESGSFALIKDTCYVQFFEAGKVVNQQKPLIDYYKIIVKEALNGTDSWNMLPVSSASCNSTIIQTGNDIKLITTQSDASGVFTVTYDKPDGQKIQIIARYINNDDTKAGKYKYSFTDITNFDGTITLDEQKFTRANTDLVSFDKNQTANKHLIFEKDGIRIIYDNENNQHDLLWATKIQDTENIIQVINDYADIKNALAKGDTMTLDPTWGYTTGTGFRIDNSGFVSTSCENTPNVKITSENVVRRPASSGSSICIKSFDYWNISSLAAPITVSQVNLRYNVLSASSLNCDFVSTTSRHSGSSASELWNAIRDGTAYVSNNSGCTTTGSGKVLTLGSTANTEFANATNTGILEFGLGIKFNSMTRTGTTFQTDMSTTPELQVTYTVANPATTPTNVQARTLSTTNMNVTWSASGVITGFKVERASPSGGSFSTVTSNTGNATARYTDTGLGAGTQFAYRISAINSTDTSAASKQNANYTLTNAPTSLGTTAASTSQIDLSWTAPSGTVRGYKIERETPVGGGFSTIVANTTTTTTSYSSTGLTAGTQYNYKVSAINQGGISAASSASNTYTITNPPTSLIQSLQTTSSFRTSWTAPSGTVTGYKIERETPVGGGFSTIVANTGNSTARYDSTGLAAGTQYNVRVSAINAGGTSAASSASNTYTTQVAPTSLSTSLITNTSARISWVNPSGNFSGFKVEKESPVGGGFSIVISETGNSTARYDLTGLSSGTQYNVRVSTNYDSTVSSPSNAISFYTTIPPIAPTGLTTPTQSTSQIIPRWNTSTGATWYLVDRESPIGGGFAQIVNVTTNSYSNTGLTAGTQYNYRVWSGNASGTSVSASTASANYTLTNAPTGLTARNNSTTNINLSWTAPSGTITGYKIEEKVSTGSFTVRVANTTTTITTYSASGLTPGVLYTYRVSAHNAGGTSQPSNEASDYTINPPDKVTSLITTDIADKTIDLKWTQPGLNSGTLEGYQVNYTTPFAKPLTVLVNNTHASFNQYHVSGLTQLTNYSFRVSAWTQGGNNATGKILNVTTLAAFAPANFTSGFLNVNATNINDINIKYKRIDINATALNLEVTYPNHYNLTCSFYYKFARTTQTYTNLPSEPVGANDKKSTFQFINVNNEIIDVFCHNPTQDNSGRYILTISNIPFINQINSFRSGEFGTTGEFGIFDFVTLSAIILSMIGFNRVNETVGVIFSIMLIGGLAVFQIIQFPTVIISALALVIMLTVASTRKLAAS